MGTKRKVTCILRKLQLIFTFYKSFAPVSGLITLLCGSISYAHGINTFTTLFWFKVITLGLIFLYLYAYKKKELYYYRNLGLSAQYLWSVTLILDMVFFISLITLSLSLP